MRVSHSGGTSSFDEAPGVHVFGRFSGCAVVFSDPTVALQHFALSWDGASWHIEPLDGTVFLGGKPIDRTSVDDAITIRIGHPENGPWITLDPAAGAPTVATALPVFAVYDLTVETNGVKRLDRVSFELGAGEMLAIVGGSGAGKSTLLKAMTGSEPATSGMVMFEQRDLYRDFVHLRHRVGYVPQDDILHAALTVRATLEFGAMLRMPDASLEERSARISEVLDELGLTPRVDGKVTELSGGQRKRLNVALELLSRPPLLILDEPTSGLDPANERSLMQLLRKLADGGRTVIVVTHSTESLHLCNEVLFVARGGNPVYLGPPHQLAQTLRAASLVDAFEFVDNHPEPALLRAQFDESRAPTRRPKPLEPYPKPAPAPWPARWSNESERIGRDFWILLRRSVEILRSDRRNAVILAAQAPVIALLMLTVFGSRKLTITDGVSTGASSVLLALVLSVVFVGATGAVREIVKERPILLREQAIGVSTVSYIASKMVLQGALVVVEAVFITFFTLLRQGTTEDGFVGLGSTTEIVIAVALAGLGAVMLGLLISAVVTSADKAMTLLPVALFVQLLLAGVIVPVRSFGIQQLSWLVNTQWGLNGVASVSDLWSLRGCALVGPDGKPPNCSTMWQHSGSNWVVSVLLLTVLFVGATWLTFRFLRRRDPAVVLAGLGASA